MKANGIKALSFTLLLWLLFLPTTVAWAIPIESVPNPRRANGTWVSDVANILSVDTELQLNHQISQLKQRNGSEIAVVTVPDLLPYDNSKSYATNLFNTWGIGKRGIDNGVLLLVAVKERRLEIETGRGITPHLSNEQVAQIIASQIKPQLQVKNFDRGVLDGVTAISDRLASINYAPTDFTAIYNLIGVAGLLLAISSIAWLVYKINAWRRSPLAKNNNSKPALVLQIKIPQLSEIANIPLRLTTVAMGAIAVGINGWRSPYIFPNASILDGQFLDVLLGNLLMALASLPLWFGLVYYWLAKVAKVIQKPSPTPIGIMFMQALAKDGLLLVITQASLLFVAALIASPDLQAIFPSYEPLLIINFVIAVSYQWLWGNVANHVTLDADIADDRYFCSTCQNLAPQLDSLTTNSYLSKPEQIAIEIGNATYSAYSCDRCYPVDAEGQRSRQHIYCYPRINNSDSICPKCTYPTRIIVPPTKSRRDRKFPKKDAKEAMSIWQCQNCPHEEPIYPYVSKSVARSSDRSSSSDYYDSGYNSSNSYGSSDYGSSSSSSDFGGGSSDGGGAGSDW